MITGDVQTEDMEVKKADEVMETVDFTEPAESSERDLQVVQVMREVQDVIHPICVFHIVDFRELVIRARTSTREVVVGLCRFRTQ